MSDIFSQEELAVLKKAGELELQVQEIGDKIDEMLTPVMKKLLENKSPEQLKKELPEAIEKFPRGFHRSEIRTLMAQLGIR